MTRANTSTVFMQWAWHYSWWQVFARPNDVLHILTWRSEGTLVGLLPLYRKGGKIPGTFGLRLVSTGEPQLDEVATEYGDLLADPSVEQELAQIAAGYILSFKQWSDTEFVCLLDNSVLLAGLRSYGLSKSIERSAGLRYRVALDAAEPEYLESLGKSRAKRIKRSQRAAERDGGITVTAIQRAEDIDEAFQDLASLNHERLTQKQRKSVFESKRFNQFHHDVCHRLFETGEVNIIRFHLDKRLLAALYCFYDDDNCHYYQSGFKRKDANRYMPLTLAHLLEMQRCRESGRGYYDLMRGQQPTYKDEFGGETTAMFDIKIYKNMPLYFSAILYRRMRVTAAQLVRKAKALRR